MTEEEFEAAWEANDTVISSIMNCLAVIANHLEKTGHADIAMEIDHYIKSLGTRERLQ